MFNIYMYFNKKEEIIGFIILPFHKVFCDKNNNYKYFCMTELSFISCNYNNNTIAFNSLNEFQRQVTYPCANEKLIQYIYEKCSRFYLD